MLHKTMCVPTQVATISPLLPFVPVLFLSICMHCKMLGYIFSLLCCCICHICHIPKGGQMWSLAKLPRAQTGWNSGLTNKWGWVRTSQISTRSSSFSAAQHHFLLARELVYLTSFVLLVMCSHLFTLKSSSLLENLLGLYHRWGFKEEERAAVSISFSSGWGLPVCLK